MVTSPNEEELAAFYRLNEELIAAGLRGEDALDGVPFEEAVTPSEWKICARFRLTAEINHLFSVATGYAGPELTDEVRPGAVIAHPIVLVHIGSLPVLKAFPVSITKGDPSMQAKMETEFLRPAYVGTTFTEWGRLVDKYVRRGRRYLVSEGRFVDEDGTDVQRYRLTRMVGKNL
jgi:hypothetical protein